MSKQETNVIKGIAVIMLLFHHLFYNTKTYDGFNVFFAGGEKEQSVITGIAVICKLCVAVFAFLSAYGLSKQYYEKGVLSSGSMVAKDAFSRYVKLIINGICVYIPFAIISLILQKHTIIQIYQSDNLLKSIKYFLFDILGLAYIFDTPKFNSTWWYLSLAILIIFTVPVICMINKKIGWAFVVLVLLFLPLLSQIPNSYFDYLLGLAIAVAIANGNTVEKFKQFLGGHLPRILISIFIIVIVMIGFTYLRHKKIIPVYYADNILAGLLVFLVISLLQIKIMKYPMAALSFLGGISMNIFLCHTFIYNYLFKSFIFSFKYWWLILFMLLLTSGLIAWGLEKIKNVLGVYKLINVISHIIVGQ